MQGVATITARNPVKKLPEYPDEPETALPEKATFRFREEIINLKITLISNQKLLIKK